ECAVHQLATGRRLRDIAGQKETATPQRFNRPLHFEGVRFFLRQEIDGDVSAFPGVEERDGTPDARITAGDQRDLAFELPGGAVFWRVPARSRIELRFKPWRTLMLRRKRKFGFGLNLRF